MTSAHRSEATVLWPSPRAAGIALVSCLGVLSVLVVLAVVAQGPFAVDRRMANWVAGHRPGAATAIMRVITLAGSSLAVVAVLIVTALRSRVRRNYRDVGLVAGITIGAWVASQLLKLLIARPRPAVLLATGTFSNFAFPSGHATTAAALWGSVAWLVGRRLPDRHRVGLLAGWILSVVLVDCSRIELGAHWLSDVIAGSLLGTAALAAAVLLDRRWEPDAERGLASGSEGLMAGDVDRHGRDEAPRPTGIEP